MAPKQKKVEKKSTRTMITYKVKKEIIEKHEEGMRIFELARLYKKTPSTICAILKNKTEIMGRDAAKGVTRMSKNRPRILEDVEKLLLLWVKEKQQAGAIVTESSICEKAKALYADLLTQKPGLSAGKEGGFKASRGWFDNFKRRSGIHSVVRHGEVARSDVEAAEAFASQFQEFLFSQSYLSEQVFKCDETGLLRKKVPKKTYIAEEESAVPVKEDPLTCAPASEEEHEQDPTTDELMDLHCEEQQEVMEESLSAEEEEENTEEEIKVEGNKEENKEEESLASQEIKDIWKHWEIVQTFVEKQHPNKAVVVRVMNLFNDSAMSHFRDILKRQKQVSLERLLQKVPQGDNSDSSSEK